MNLNDLNSKLYSYFALEEVNNTRTDWINGINLFETNGTTSYSIGKNNNCASFNGHSYLYSPYGNYFFSTNGFLISLWAFFESTGYNFATSDYNASYDYIMEKNNCFSIYTSNLDTTKKWKAKINDTEIYNSSWTAADSDKWYHVCLGASNGIMFFSVRSNSGLLYKTETYVSLTNDYQDLLVGRTLKGRLDEIAIWYEPNITSIDEFLDIEDEIYQSGRGLFYNNFKSLWEISVSVNNVTSYPPLEKNPDEERPDSLENIITYSYYPTVSYGNNASDNKATTPSINSYSLSIGTISPGETSATQIIKLEAPDSITIRNIKIGLIDAGGITFTDETFGIESRNYLDYNIVPSTYFSGISDGTSSSVYNVSIDSATRTTSYYMYLNVKIPRNFTFTSGTIRYKWFFDYA